MARRPAPPEKRSGWTPLVRWTFEGPRFAGSGLDLRDLRSMYAYRNIVTSFAHDIWMRDNETRERAPRRFGDHINLRFFTIVDKCAQVDIYRQMVTKQGDLFIGFTEVDQSISDNLPEATDMFTIVLTALRHNRKPPFNVDKAVLRQFKHVGENIRSGEHLDIETFEPSKRDGVKRILEFVPHICVDNAFKKSVALAVSEQATKLPDEAVADVHDVEFSGRAKGILDNRGEVDLDVHGRGRLGADKKIRGLTNVSVVVVGENGTDTVLTRDVGSGIAADMSQPMTLEEFANYVSSPGGPLSQMPQDSADALREMLRIAASDPRPAQQALIDDLERLIADTDNLQKKDGES